MFQLSKELIFPPTYLSDEDGLLCVGGDLSKERLLLAYRSGIFPWYSEGEPILWYSPAPRFVLFPAELQISKSMQQVLRSERFEFRLNTDFASVIRHCREIERNGQDGTWITDAMQQAYLALHHEGHALSAECYEEGELVGGLYGILGKRVFFGESMFSLKPNASKFAFIHFVNYWASTGGELVDCQVYTPHLERFGARMIARNEFESYLF